MTMAEAPLKRMTDTQLLDLERAYWTALKLRDALAAGRMTAEDCTIVGATGVSSTDARTTARTVGSAPHDLKEFRIDPSTVRITHLSDDAAVISYGVQKEVRVDGSDVRVDAFDASVWRREHGEWTCVLHTESIAGDAFGRDRKPVEAAAAVKPVEAAAAVMPEPGTGTAVGTGTGAPAEPATGTPLGAGTGAGA